MTITHEQSSQPTAGPPRDAGAPGEVVLESVTKVYGTARAVDELDLTVSAGEFISLLGPSGCGKTTTLRMIAGFERPDAGDIRISGQSVIGRPPYKRQVNTVFQAYALFPHMSVAENVAYGLQQKRTPKADVIELVSEALDMVQMRSFADRAPTQLSGGQQQRIALARALVNRPGVLLLDEPLGALDRQLREEMQLELKLLQSRLGITFIFVTHDQGEALSMSDRIAVMRAGRIEQLADADTVYSQPASAYVAAFIGQQNFLVGTLADDGATVQTAHGPMRGADTAAGSPGTQTLVGGDRVQAAVRPEYVEIDASEPTTGNDNAVRGRLIGVSHLGETMQYLVQLDHDESMLVRRPMPVAPRLNVGDTVWCHWSPADVQIFAADDSASDGGYVVPPTSDA